MIDPVDAIMIVMQEAFDPAFGEGWTRAQISDALILPNTHYQLATSDGRSPTPATVQGFTLSRNAVDEEELLLIAVRPRFRGLGIGSQLMKRFRDDARARGVRHLFLEMREGNNAEMLYHAFGFTCVGRRKDYYRKAQAGPLDALTYKCAL